MPQKQFLSNPTYWLGKLTGADPLEKLIRNKQQPLGRYFGTSVYHHVDRSAGGKAAARQYDDQIMNAALSLARSVIASDRLSGSHDATTAQTINKDEVKAALACATARTDLEHIILDHFGFPGSGNNQPVFWDFKKSRFEASQEEFEAELKHQVDLFIETVRQNYAPDEVF